MALGPFPRQLAEICGVNLLSLACKPPFLDGCTTFELELLEHLETAGYRAELARADIRRLVLALLNGPS